MSWWCEVLIVVVLIDGRVVGRAAFCNLNVHGNDFLLCEAPAGWWLCIGNWLRFFLVVRPHPAFVCELIKRCRSRLNGFDFLLGGICLTFGAEWFLAVLFDHEWEMNVVLVQMFLDGLESDGSAIFLISQSYDIILEYETLLHKFYLIDRTASWALSEEEKRKSESSINHLEHLKSWLINYLAVILLRWFYHQLVDEAFGFRLFLAVEQKY